MKRYIVYFEGEIEIEAESKENAEFEATLQLGKDYTITEVELVDDEE